MVPTMRTYGFGAYRCRERLRPELRSGFVALTYSDCTNKRGRKSLTLVGMSPRRPAGGRLPPLFFVLFAENKSA